MIACVLVVAYLVGAVPASNIVAHLTTGRDLRRFGTGTVSGSGLYGLAGFGAMAVGGLADIAKGSFGPALALAVTHDARVAALAAGCAVIGHNWSVFLRGAGGRGLSPAMGAGLVVAWPATAVLALGLSVGRLLRNTALFSAFAVLALVPVLWLTDGGDGVLLGVAVALPIVVKRVMGNAPPARWSATVVTSRLLLDRDTVHREPQERWPRDR